MIESGTDAFPAVHFNPPRREVIIAGEHRRLTRARWLLLEALWCGRGRTQSRERLINALYAIETDRPRDPKNVLTVHVCHLREALRGAPYQIDTIRGQGYRLEV